MLDLRDIVSGGLFQLGYVFPHASVAEGFLSGLGAGNFTRFEDAPVHSQFLRGRPMECRQNLSFGFLGPLNVELVEPIEGRNIYTEFLEAEPAGGLHHIAWKVADIDAAIAAMMAQGLGEVQSGQFGAGTRFSYFDTRDPLGHFVELLMFDEETEALFASLRSAAP